MKNESVAVGCSMMTRAGEDAARTNCIDSSSRRVAPLPPIREVVY